MAEYTPTHEEESAQLRECCKGVPMSIVNRVYLGPLLEIACANRDNLVMTPDMARALDEWAALMEAD